MTLRASLLTTVAVSVALTFVAVSGPTLEGQAADRRAALLNPAQLSEQAPAEFSVNFETSKGAFVIDVHRDWAPLGADRFYILAKNGYYDENRFFFVNARVATFGLTGDPEVDKVWMRAKIPNDKTRVHSNVRGTVAFAQSNGRKTQTAISLTDNSSMDPLNTPFGEVVAGMGVVDQLYNGYGEMFPTGNAPTMSHIIQGGNAFLMKNYPDMDYIKMATLVP